MRSAVDPGALVTRFSLPKMRPRSIFAIPTYGSALLTVQRLPPPNQPASGDADGAQPLAADYVVPGHLPSDSVKDQYRRLSLDATLDISWKATWLLKHKLMEAMLQREVVLPLQGNIRIDDAYLGGEHCGGKPGRGSENKVAFVAAVEMHEGRPQRVRFDALAGFLSLH